MLYCYLENGQIVEGPRGLPRSTPTCSGFDLQSNEELRALGWLPYRAVRTDQSYMEEIGSSIEITDTEVVETFQYRALTQEEIDAIHAQERETDWGMVANEINRRIQETNWTQLPGSGLSDQDVLNWKSYRAALLDVTNQDDPKNIVWPQEPGQGIGVATL